MNQECLETPDLGCVVKVKSQWYLLNHPFYQSWMTGDLKLETLQEYARQYYHHVKAFPNYLGDMIECFKCENEDGRFNEAIAILQENLADEKGQASGQRPSAPHPELWQCFAEGIGVARESLSSIHRGSAIEEVIRMFQDLSQCGKASALGSLFAYESQIPEIATSKIEGLIKNYQINDEKTLKFFRVHEQADIYHRQALVKFLNELEAQEQVEAQGAADRASEALWRFLTAMQSFENSLSPLQKLSGKQDLCAI